MKAKKARQIADKIKKLQDQFEHYEMYDSYELIISKIHAASLEGFYSIAEYWCICDKYKEKLEADGYKIRPFQMMHYEIYW